MRITFIDKIKFKLGIYPHYWYGWTKPEDYGENAIKMDILESRPKEK